MKMSVSPCLSFIYLFFVVFFSIIKVSWCTTFISCPEIEKQSLLNFKQLLHDPYNWLYSWDAEVSCCEWAFVSCNNLTGNVRKLNLQECSLSGELSFSLINLKHLKHLDLSKNDFHGSTIPSFIGSLASLEYLDLSSSNFQGKLPHSIGNLSNLQTLRLTSDCNVMTEDYLEFSPIIFRPLQVDSLEWLSRLSKLEHLIMDCTDLSKAYDWEKVINKLPSLVELRLSQCNLSVGGPVNNMTTSKLVTLDLSVNNISRIPEWVYFSKDLDFLNLKGNIMRDEIFDFIANLTYLSHLDLSANQLYGKIPRGMNNLCKLQYLDLSQNKLEGEISDLFGNTSSCPLGVLETLDLGHNQLSGGIPSDVGNLSYLRGLYLDHNNLFGNLPETVGQLSNLVILYIENNMLEGVVTETHFVRLSNLSVLHASENNLTLKVDPNWIPPFKIIRLELNSWNLGSRIPSWLDTQKMSITSLDLSNAGLNDNVPSWIFSIENLDLSHNQLYGKIPIISFPAKFVNLCSNRFSGQLPRLSTSSLLSVLLNLDLSNNLFSGDLSDLLCNTSTSNEPYTLNLGGNHLSGALPNCFIKWSSLLMLNLSNNNLSGRIPNSIGLLAGLQSLNLNGNNFSGDIPLSMGNYTQLLKINLGDNNLSGNQIPTSLPQLRILILKSNRLSGEITSAICKLSSLKILDLSNNMFSGTIPRCVNNFTAMTTRRDWNTYKLPFIDPEIGSEGTTFQESASIYTKGRELTYNIILSLVTSFDISRNDLSGNIPDGITSLVELRSLNLSGNQLEGPIPFAIGNMTQLESLDFSNNSLSGELPNSLKAMSSLNYLNVSYNQLAGRIPESTQFCSLDGSSFVGNLQLWGPPLTSSCVNSGGKAPHGTTHTNDEEVDKPEIEWLYVFISLGCAIGLSASLTTLYLKRTWRAAYFELIEDMWDTAYVYVHINWRNLKTALGVNM